MCLHFKILKMKRITIILAISLLFCSCGSNNSEDGLPKLFTTKQNVNTVSCQSIHGDNLLKINSLAIDNVNFYLYDKSADTMVLTVNKKDGHKSRFLVKGQGPNDAVTVETMCPNGGNVYFFNLNLSKVLRYNATTGEVCPDSAASAFALDNVTGTSWAFVGDTVFIPILNNENRFVVKTPEQETYFGKIDSTSEHTSEEYGWILQPKICVNPVQEKMFWGSTAGDAYGIYDYSDLNNIKQVCLQLYELPATSTNNRRAFLPETKFGLLSGTSNQDYIYVLYSGKQLKSVLKGTTDLESMELASNILVMDWEGNPVKHLLIDHELRDIYYDKYDNKLYGIELKDDEYSLCKIPL